RGTARRAPTIATEPDATLPPAEEAADLPEEVVLEVAVAVAVEEAAEGAEDAGGGLLPGLLRGAAEEAGEVAGADALLALLTAEPRHHEGGQHRHELERLPAVEAGGAGDALGGGLLPLPEDVAEDARAVGGAAGGRPAGGAAEEAAEQPPQAPAPAEEAVEEAAVVVAFEGLVERLRALGRARVALHLPEQEREGGRRGRPRLLLVGADGAADLLEGRALEDRAEEAGEVCHEERGLGGA